jgi:crotonobetainyl-CoA:carnitine CoA-transferase CaiB-like acyl-CoA transferase
MTTDETAGELPLSDVRVIDLTDGKAELTARFLGDLGADVIRIALPRCDTRDAAIRNATHNANKRIVPVDVTAPDGRARLHRLLATADILVEDLPPGRLDSLGIGPDALLSVYPQLVVVSVTDFGQTGPYRDWVGSDRVHLALGGVLSRSGIPGLPPLLPPGPLAMETAAIQAAWAALIAYFNRLSTGLGDHVDVSIYEVTAQAIDPGYGIAGSATGGVPHSAGPRGRPDVRHLYPIFSCADGHVRICVLSPRQWRGMRAWLGEPAEFADPAYDDLGARFAASDRLFPAYAALFAGRVRAELVETGQRYGVPIAGLMTLSEVLQEPHLAARGAFTDLDVAPGISARVPNGFIEFDGVRAGLRRPARIAADPDDGPDAPVPTTGGRDEHVESLVPPPEPGAAQAASQPTRRRPFAGLRVLDLGVIVVGAEVGRLFSDMGAEVIKIEAPAFPDGSRQSITGAAMTASFAWGNRGKLGLGLDLRSARGRELFLQLAAKSDVILSNFKPGTLESLGLGYDVLRNVNPQLVVADSSAFGASGSWAKRMGYGPLVRASTGLTGLWAYPGTPDGFCDASTVYPDHAAARVEAAAVAAALIARRRTGRGAKISASQAETMLGQFADMFATESLSPGAVVAVGNVGPGDAPRGLYPCLGDDEWCVVDIRGDEDFPRLCGVLDRADLASDPDLADAAGRVAHRAALDAAVAGWTRRHRPRTAMQLLQQARVPAGMMQRVSDYTDDPHLQARRFFQRMKQPGVDEPMPTENAPACFRRVADPQIRPAPFPGQHTRELAARLLDLNDSEVDQLISDGVLTEWASQPTIRRPPANTPARSTP